MRYSKLIVLAGVIMTAALVSNAQKFEGRIVLGIEYENLPPEAEAYKSMMPSEVLMYLKGNLTRTEQMSMGGTTITITDTKSKSVKIFLEMMGQKMRYSGSADGMKRQKYDDKEPKIEYTSDTREIAGYACKKALVSIEGDEEHEPIEVWYTTEIPSDNSIQFPGLKGFPLAYSITDKGMTMIFTAKEVSKETVSKSLFDVDESGYTPLTPDQMKQMGLGG